MESVKCSKCSGIGDPAVRDCIKQFGREQGNLLPILHAVQKEYGYLPADAMEEVADWVGIPASEVYGTATFYTLFSMKPLGKYVVRLCDSPPCHVEGSVSIRKAIEAHLGVGNGETTPDGLFTLEVVSCFGLCGVAPAIMVNDDVYGNLTPEMIPAILGKYGKEGN